MTMLRTRYKAAGLAVSLALTMLALSPAARATSVFFSDLGSPVNYNADFGWTVSGTGGTGGTSYTAANLFTSAFTGSVGQIDLGVTWAVGPDPFTASIWTDASGLPGTEVPGASWTGLLASAHFGSSSNSLVTINVSGVSLSAGQSYFLILAPTSVNDNSWNAWNWNTQGINGLDLYSTNGGTTWNSNGTGNPLGAFDILGAPAVAEPSTVGLLGLVALAGLLVAISRRQGNSPDNC